MMRRAGTIALCLVLGALVNVAAAWGCALLRPPDGSTVDKAESVTAQQRWFVARWAPAATRLWFSRRVATDEPPATNQPAGRPDDLLPRWSPLREPLPLFRAGLSPIEERLVLAHGWPRHAFHVELRRDDAAAAPGRLTVIGGIPTPWTWTGPTLDPVILPRALPWRPVWSGLLVNTLLYAAVLWVAQLLITRTRRPTRAPA